MDTHELLLRYVYIPLAAIAGSITALAFADVSQMSRGQIYGTLFAGFSFALFVAPWLAYFMFGVSVDDARAVTCMTYVLGAGSNILLPAMIKRLKRMIDAEKDAA